MSRFHKAFLPFLPCVAILLSGCFGEPGGTIPPSGGSSLGGGVHLGIDVLEASGFAALRGKRVGLITNQTSVNRRGQKTRMVLKQAPQVNLVALYVPEHGLDGTEKAAVHISNRRDPLTGLTAYSLYGPTRKPTPAMLAGIDILLFDLQDIGSRSYTYISTMVRAMEACGENGKEFMVLDRPNPIGGLRVQGPGLEQRWISFVGQIPVPYVHGMTAGELAQMSNARGWNARRCQLTVIPMKGWSRAMMWEDTHLRWVPTSPNIPGSRSPLYYAATGILGSLDGCDIGIGTNAPFEYVGGPGVNAVEFTQALNSLNLSGVRFSPYQSSRKAGFAGSRIQIDPRSPVDVVGLNVIFIDALNRRISKDLFARTSSSTKDIFYKCYGSTGLETGLRGGKSPQAIIGSWQNYLAAFQKSRQSYLIYR